MYKAEIRMQGTSISVTVDHDRDRITVFKSRDNNCDFQVFDIGDQDEIIEYIISPLAQERWAFRAEE